MGADHEAALLAQIRERPDDDELRLVFADALSERGDPWGELIVAGCDLARLARDGVVDAERRRELAKRCRAIQRDRWRDRRWVFDASLDRGFCTSVHVEREVAQVAGYEFAVLRDVRFGASAASIAALADWPLLGQVDRLAARYADDHTGRWWQPEQPAPRSAAFARVGERARPSSLELNRVALHDAELSTLAQSPLRGSLRRFALIHGPEAAIDLDWPALEALALVAVRLTGESIGRALGRPALDSLTSLDVSSNNLGDTGMRAILDRALPNLRTLRIRQASLGARAMSALAGSSLVQRLTALSVGEQSADPTAGALAAVAEAAGLLVELEIDQRSLKEAGAVQIIRSLRAPLQTLRLCGGEHGLAIVTALLNNPALRGLRWLDLSGQPISHAAAAALARAELPSLERLDLVDCRLDGESAYALACSATLPRRVALRLHDNRPGVESAIEALQARFHDVRY